MTVDRHKSCAQTPDLHSPHSKRLRPQTTQNIAHAKATAMQAPAHTSCLHPVSILLSAHSPCACQKKSTPTPGHVADSAKLAPAVLHLQQALRCPVSCQSWHWSAQCLPVSSSWLALEWPVPPSVSLLAGTAVASSTSQSATAVPSSGQCRYRITPYNSRFHKSFIHC